MLASQCYQLLVPSCKNTHKHIIICFFFVCNVVSKILAHTIANPTSAFFKAGPSLVPSPVTATTCLRSPTVLSIIPENQPKISRG